MTMTPEEVDRLRRESIDAIGGCLGTVLMVLALWALLIVLSVLLS